MKYVLILCLVSVLYLLINDRFDDKYKKGYEDGIKSALKTNPPSEDLEITCASLWIGEQNKKYWEREKNK